MALRVLEGAPRRPCRAVQPALVVEGQILSTRGHGTKGVRTVGPLSEKQTVALGSRVRRDRTYDFPVKRERENKTRSDEENGIRRAKSWTSNEEVRKHLSIPTRFCGSWSSPRESMETESILRTADHRYHVDWYRSDREREQARERERETERVPFTLRGGTQRDAKLPAATIRTSSGRTRHFRSLVKREAA